MLLMSVEVVLNCLLTEAVRVSSPVTSSVAVRLILGCLRTIHVCLSYPGFQVDFTVVSLCTACVEHIWNLTVQTVSDSSEVRAIVSPQQVSSTHLTRQAAEQVLQFTECLGSELAGTEPIGLQLPRGATGSGSAQTSTTPVTRLIDTKSLLQVTPYHGDKASFSWLEVVFLDRSACNQQTTL